MMYNNSGNICRMGCWGFAAGIGVTIAVWLQGSVGWGLFSAFLVGTVIGIILALVFPRLFCKGAEAAQADGVSNHLAAQQQRGVAGQRHGGPVAVTSRRRAPLDRPRRRA